MIHIKAWNLALNLCIVFFIRSKTNAARKSTQYVLHARMALDGSGYLSQLDQFKIAKVRDFAELDGFSCLRQIFND